MNNCSSEPNKFIKKQGTLISSFQMEDVHDFNPIVGKPQNIDKVTLNQIDNLNISYLFSTGRSASTLLGIMLMMHEQVIFTSEEVFPIILKQKYQKINRWTEETIKNYCADFILMSEGKLYPFFCGKDVLYELLLKFKEHLNYKRVIRISYLAFGINKDLSKVTTIIDKQLRYYLAHHYLKLFPHAKVLLLVRDPRDNVYSKFKRAEGRSLFKPTCLYIHTWIYAFHNYFKILKQYHTPFHIVNYEKLINESTTTLQNISQFLSIPYTEKFFNYPTITNHFFQTITHQKLKEHFYIIHKSITQPINPQKINEWKNYMNNSEITTIINATWTDSKRMAEKLNYTEHANYRVKKFNCWKTKLKIKLDFLSSYIYFSLIPYFIKRYIKKKKYPYRINALSTYDLFLRPRFL